MIFRDPYILRFEPDFGWYVSEQDTAFEPISDEEAYEILDLDYVESYLPRDLLIEEIEGLGADDMLKDWEMEKMRLKKPQPPLVIEDLLDDLGFENEIEAEYGPRNLASLVRQVIDKLNEKFEFYWVEDEVECKLKFTLLFLHVHVRLEHENGKTVWQDHWSLNDISEVSENKVIVFPKILGSLILEGIKRNKKIVIREKEGLA